MTFEQSEAVRKPLAVWLKRAEAIIEQTNKLPLASCDMATALFARSLAHHAQREISWACECTGMLRRSLIEKAQEGEALKRERQQNYGSDENMRRLRYENKLKSTGASYEQTETANYMLAARIAKVVAEGVSLAEDCLRGKRDMSGNPIRRGALYNK